jgi:cobyrinic acid a,c-diamide synthase
MQISQTGDKVFRYLSKETEECDESGLQEYGECGGLKFMSWYDSLI